jgi:dipeptidyl aminopeptidase/acylaminoacyl peptidase
MIRNHRTTSALVGAAAAALTVSALAAMPASSGTNPGDNGLIAFAGTPDTNNLSDTDIYTYDPASRVTTKVTTGNAYYVSPAWSPDGSRLAYSAVDLGSNTSVVYLANPDGSNATPVSSPPGTSYNTPSFSADGQQLALTSFDNTSGQRSLVITDLAGNIVRTINTNGLRPETPEWSPDGGKIAVTAVDTNTNKSQIYTVNPDGSDFRPVTSGQFTALAPSWTPDGTQITYQRIAADEEAWIVQADGSNNRELVLNPVGGDAALPIISPDGNKVLYLGYDRQVQRFALITQNLDGSDEQILETVDSNGTPLQSSREAAWQPVNAPEPPAGETELTVKAMKASKKLAVGDKRKLVKSASTNGEITKVKIVCKIEGDKVKNKAAKNSCNAKEKKKDDPTTAKVVAKPKCDTKVKIKAVVTAQYQQTDPAKWKRTWKVKKNTGPNC